MDFTQQNSLTCVWVASPTTMKLCLVFSDSSLWSLVVLWEPMIPSHLCYWIQAWAISERRRFVYRGGNNHAPPDFLTTKSVLSPWRKAATWERCCQRDHWCLEGSSSISLLLKWKWEGFQLCLNVLSGPPSLYTTASLPSPPLSPQLCSYDDKNQPCQFKWQSQQAPHPALPSAHHSYVHDKP